MKLKNLIFPCLFLLSSWAMAQTRINSDFAFQSDPAKKYSLYIPSTYDAQTPNSMMVGLHPFNTSRWDAESWCDTLIAFAEANALILACPDGGADGQVDDAIDTAFTTALIDSMHLWYNLDPASIYCMGFSWGGKTTYSYGFRNPNTFCGYLPIGAAISNGEVSPTLMGNVRNKPVYVVHGGNDNPNTRFWPVVNALPDSGVVLNYLLIPGVGHTIDFANRNQILNTAYEWIDSVCHSGPVTALADLSKQNIEIYPNPSPAGQNLHLSLGDLQVEGLGLRLWGMKGERYELKWAEAGGEIEIQLAGQIQAGVYVLEIKSQGQHAFKKIVFY